MDENLATQSAKALPEQFLQAWEKSREINFPPQYSEAVKVVIAGMGASGLPGDIITNAFLTNAPIVLVNDYKLPPWADSKTLVFLSSYSGDTEEIISLYAQARNNKCLITGATTGGELGRLFEEGKHPAYIYNPKHNPSGQPRMGLGYGVFAQLGILYKLGMVRKANQLLTEDVETSLKELQGVKGDIETKAREFAKSAKAKVLLVLGAEHLKGNTHAFSNQLNETSKTLSSWFSLPEANHHLLEGLKNPQIEIIGIFLDSEIYSSPLQERSALTKEVFEKNGHKIYSYQASLKTPLGQVMETLYFSSLASLSLAQDYGEDPLAIPWVDYFKKDLSNLGR